MKALSTLLLCLLSCSLAAISSLPGPGHQAFEADGREYVFAYHAGTDDYHLYGSGVWAVRFDFSEVYPAMTTSEFVVDKALLYFPQTGDSARVELFSDAMGLPGSSLTWAKVPVTSNQLEVQFPVSVQNDSLWLVVTYATNYSNRYVSASEGGGTHSYYWNTNSTHPYFQSLGSAGYNAELLFGLGGEFALSGMDLELMSFDLEGTIAPREMVGPTFSIYNHSDVPISDAAVNLNVYSPDPGFAFFDPIIISETIPPRSQYVFDSSSPGYAEHQFALPGTPMQLKLRAALSSGYQDSDPQANNVSLIHRFSFENPYPAYLAENFLRYEYSAPINQLQDLADFPDIHVLNCFPILSDSLGNVASQMRFNWYGFNSLPRTAINGDLRINGFSTSYGDQYSQLCGQALLQKSFVSGSACAVSHLPESDMLAIRLSLDNASTLLYATATEYNLVGQSRLFAGMFRKEQFNGAQRYALSRWITHGAVLDGTLGAGESLTVELNLALNNLSLTELAENYRLYYWLQLVNGGRILYADWSGFDTIVALPDEEAAVPRLLISSNPLRSGGTMRISLGGGQSLLGAQIYNLKGQRILAYPESCPEIQLDAGQFPASGVYLLRVALNDGKGARRELNRKIFIIK